MQLKKYTKSSFVDPLCLQNGANTFSDTQSGSLGTKNLLLKLPLKRGNYSPILRVNCIPYFSTVHPNLGRFQWVWLEIPLIYEKYDNAE